MRVIAIAYTAGGGDFHPVVALCVGLGARGHDVSLFCDPEGAAAVASNAIPAIVDTQLWAQVNAAQDDWTTRISTAEAGRREQLVVEWLERRAAMMSPVFAEVVRARRPDLVLSAWLTGSVAREASLAAGVPLCVVNSSYDTRRETGSAVLHATASGLRGASLLLHATDPVFDEATPVAGERYVGPLQWEPPGGVPDYLREDGPPWALVTVSLIPQGDIALVPLALRALSGMGLRAVATIGPRNDLTELGPLPDRARVERSISHAAVLERARLMVGHAGHGSVSKALWYGVPMVLVPWGRDQPGVAARAERLGVARVVAPRDLASLGQAIRDVLTDPGYGLRASRHSARLRTQDPVSLACDIIEERFARPAGAATT